MRLGAAREAGLSARPQLSSSQNLRALPAKQMPFLLNALAKPIRSLLTSHALQLELEALRAFQEEAARLLLATRLC